MKRYWITPLTMGAFVLTAATGLLMLIEVTPGFIKPAHEWLSLTLVLGGVLHVIDHWTGIRKHLEGAWGKGFVVGALVLFALAFAPLPSKEHEVRESPADAILAKATVTQVAALAGIPVEVALEGLQKAGATTASPERTIEAIARESGIQSGRLLASVKPGPGERDDGDKD